MTGSGRILWTGMALLALAGVHLGSKAMVQRIDRLLTLRRTIWTRPVRAYEELCPQDRQKFETVCRTRLLLREGGSWTDVCETRSSPAVWSRQRRYYKVAYQCRVRVGKITLPLAGASFTMFR